MEGQPGPEQIAPTPVTPDRNAQLQQHIRNEPAPMPDFANPTPVVDNISATQNAPTLNPYGEIESPSSALGPQIISPEMQNRPANPEQDFQLSMQTIDTARSLAEALAATGDKKLASEVTEALLSGKLKGLDNPPDVAKLQEMANPANWNQMSFPKRMIVSLLIK